MLIHMRPRAPGFQLSYKCDRQFDDCGDRHRGLTAAVGAIDFVRTRGRIAKIFSSQDPIRPFEPAIVAGAMTRKRLALVDLLDRRA